MRDNKFNRIFVSLILLLVFVAELSFSSSNKSLVSQNVQASSRLRRAYIPERFRGTWYANKRDKLKITANSVSSNELGKTYTKFYHGGYKGVGKGLSRYNFIRYQRKSMIILFKKGGSDIFFRIVNHHHRKALDFERSLGHIYFYRSRIVAKRYGNY